MSSFTVQHRDSSSKARSGVLQTPHGPVLTPVFMPVGTQASVKIMGAEDLEGFGYQILLANTYHLMLRPGKDIIERAGGLHSFMSWPGAILTDSGGYQVLSLATRCRLTDHGVSFSSHLDGSRHDMTPESATEFQLDIGADIAMCLDDCPPYPSLKSDAEKSLERTALWAERCKTFYTSWLESHHRKNGDSALPLLFGISQGASFTDLRRASAARLVDIDFPGYAIGGLGVGEPRSMTWELCEASLSGFPLDRPRYLMGFGLPEDMWEGVERGVDMFDCVLPTRNGRNGQAFTSLGRLNLTNKAYRDDFGPIDPSCDCSACRRYSRSYLCHLFRAGELLGPRLVTLHNLRFMIALLVRIRTAIIHGTFQSEKRLFFETYNQKDEPLFRS